MVTQPDSRDSRLPALAAHGRVRDGAALLLIIVTITLFHARGFAPGRVFLAVDIAEQQIPWSTGVSGSLQNWLLSDPVYQSYPFVAQAIGPTDNSLWNPDLFLGHPRVADPLAQPFYPVFRMLARLFGPARGFTISLWLHLVWAGVCMFGFLRTLSLARRAAVLGALVYCLSGYAITWLEYTHRLSTMAWLPAVLWTYELAVQRRDWRYGVLSAAALGIATLCGQFQYVGAFLFLFGLYALGHALGFMHERGRSFYPLALYMAVATLGLSLAAVLLLPFYAYLPDTIRSLAPGLEQGLPLRQLLTLFVPDFFGTPTLGFDYWGSSNYNEDTIYVGVTALIIALAAAFQVRSRRTIWLAAMGLVLVYFIVGGPGVALFGKLPLVGYLSLQRSTFLLSLIAALLAAHWLDALRTSVMSVLAATAILAVVTALALAWDVAGVRSHMAAVRPGIVTSAALALGLLVLVILRGYSPYRAWTDWAIVVLVIADLAIWGAGYNPTGEADELYAVTPGLAELQAQMDGGRAAALQTAVIPTIGLNTLPLFGMADAGGYSSLAPARLAELVRRDARKGEYTGVGEWMARNGNIVFFSEPSTRLMDLLHTRYILSPEALYIHDPAIVQDSLACEALSDELRGDVVVTGMFPVRNAAINRLDLQFRRPPNASPEGQVLVQMRRQEETPVLMFEEVVDAGAISTREEDGLTSFYFAPERSAPGHVYEFDVSAVDGAATGLQLCTASDGTASHAVAGVEWHPVEAEAAAQEGLYAYGRAAPMPPAYVAYDVEYLTAGDDIVDYLLDANNDIRRTAVVESAYEDVVSQSIAGDRDFPPTLAEIVAQTPDRITLHVQTPRPGILVLGGRYHPGWQATVDGVPTPVLPVNFLQRGVVVGEGEYDVVVSFRPRSYVVGLGISVATALILLALLMVGTLTRRHREDQV